MRRSIPFIMPIPIILNRTIGLFLSICRLMGIGEHMSFVLPLIKNDYGITSVLTWTLTGAITVAVLVMLIGTRR